MRIVSAAERPDLADRADALSGQVWPEYNTHGDVVSPLWSRLNDEFREFQFVLFDEAKDETVAQGHTIPLRWDGTVEGLPAGIDGAIAAGTRDGATSLCAMAAEVLPAHRRGGLSGQVLEGMVGLARAHGLADVIAPVRPSWKERYPLVPIERYAVWTRDDGLPFDPWIRVHVRIGGEILKPEPLSLRISGTVSEWEQWTAMEFPESREYWFPQGLAPLSVNRERDEGLYYEPNVWMRHRVAPR